MTFYRLLDRPSTCRCRDARRVAGALGVHRSACAAKVRFCDFRRLGMKNPLQTGGFAPRESGKSPTHARAERVFPGGEDSSAQHRPRHLLSTVQNRSSATDFQLEEGEKCKIELLQHAACLARTDILGHRLCAGTDPICALRYRPCADNDPSCAPGRQFRMHPWKAHAACGRWRDALPLSK